MLELLLHTVTLVAAVLAAAGVTAVLMLLGAGLSVLIDEALHR